MDLTNLQKLTIGPGSEGTFPCYHAVNVSFLDLPAGLRNVIYHFAIENVPQQTAYKANGHLQAIGHRNRSHRQTRPDEGHRLRVPYLSLMQTCKAIRSEFRPLYLNQLAVPIGSVPSFISAFIEHPKMPMKIAFYEFQQSVTTLRILATPCEGLEVLPLLRLKARYRNCRVEIQSVHGCKKGAAALNHVINNTNETWLRWIDTRVVVETEISIFGPLAYFGDVWRDGMTLHVTLRTQPFEASEVWRFMGRLDCAERVGLKHPGLSVRFHRTFG